jgi:hypothetical protein
MPRAPVELVRGAVPDLQELRHRSPATDPEQAARRRSLEDEMRTADGEPVAKRRAIDPAGSAGPLKSPRSLANAESPALPALGPSASQLNDFRELLVARIQGDATPEQAGAVRNVLARMQVHPQSRQILSALQAYHQMNGEAPSIQLMDGSDRGCVKTL